MEVTVPMEATAPMAAMPPTEERLTPGPVDVLVLGAGLTGLTAARRLAEGGLRVSVLEKDWVVGGLARTVVWKGSRLDLGGHRLYFKDRDIFQDLASLFGPDEILKHRRKSSIYRDGKFLKYPPELRNIMASATFLSKAFFEASRLAGARDPRLRSLEEWVLGNFGRAVHEAYFREYTRKVWGVGADEMSAIWAEKRVGRLSALDLIKSIAVGARNKEATAEFYYPRDGVGEVCARLYERVRSQSRVILGVELRAIEGEAGRPARALFRTAAGDESLSFGSLISTIPLPALARAMEPVRPGLAAMAEGLEYRDMAIVYLKVARRPVFEEHWVYFPEESVPFSRVCELDNWSDRMAGGDLALLSCEIFCNRGDSVWGSDDRSLSAVATRSLSDLGFIHADEVRDACVVRVPYAYPLLRVGYEKTLAPLRDALEVFPNVRLAGRTGTHSYCDMEECIADARRASVEVLDSCRLRSP